jgi:flavin reductase (DIM6/NTAB) family NADH-FMN oxidoreductase RutF
MTLNWATQLAFEPKLLGIVVVQDALTHELVDAGGVFSLNIIDREDRAIVRKFTKPVDVDLERSTLNDFGVHAATTGAPVLDQAAAFLDCVVTQSVPVGDHTLFVGEVVDCGFLRDEATPVLRMEDTRMNYGG